MLENEMSEKLNETEESCLNKGDGVWNISYMHVMKTLHNYA